MNAAKALTRGALEVAVQNVVDNYKDHYNEDEIKKAVYDELQQIQDDTAVLRNIDFKTARDALVLWQESREPIESEINKDRLRLVSDSASRAFNTVADPLDKIMAIQFVIFADYHRVALSSKPPNWLGGKREAQNLLRIYYNKLPQLDDAAREEVGLKRRAIFRDKWKRRKLIQSFITLEYTVIDFYPKSENIHHPKLPDILHDAAVRVFTKNHSNIAEYLSPEIDRLITQPVSITTLSGHTGGVLCCNIFGENTIVLSGSDDRTIKAWDISKKDNNINAIGTLQGHTGFVRCCEIYAKDTRLLTGSDDKALKVWDLVSGQEVATMKGHTDSISCCAIFNSDEQAISGSQDKTVRIWDLLHYTQLYQLPIFSQPITCLSMYENLLALGHYNTIKLWDMLLGKEQEIYTLRGHTKAVSCTKIYRNGKRLISGSNDNTLKIWDIENKGREKGTLIGHTDWVKACYLYDNETKVLSASRDSTLKAWDIKTLQQIYTFIGHSLIVECCLVYTKDVRTYAISGSWDNTLRIWLFPRQYYNQNNNNQDNIDDDDDYNNTSSRRHKVKEKLLSS